MKTKELKNITEELNQLERLIQLPTMEGFIIEYFKQLSTSSSCKVAFKKVNALHKGFTGFNKFKNYNQFINTKNLYLK